MDIDENGELSDGRIVLVTEDVFTPYAKDEVFTPETREMAETLLSHKNSKEKVRRFNPEKDAELLGTGALPFTVRSKKVAVVNKAADKPEEKA